MLFVFDISHYVDSVTLIDFEYGGANYQAFDIGDHFCEFAGRHTVIIADQLPF